MHDIFTRCCVWWCCAPPVHPTCICFQCLAPLILIFHPTLIDCCGLVRSFDVLHMTVQLHWLQQSFPNGRGAQFPIFTIGLLTPIWLESHQWSSLLLFSFFLFCMILVHWIPLSLYIVLVNQRCWTSQSFIQVEAGLWPSTWAIRVVFFVSLWLFHSRGFFWSILRMLLGSLPHPHHWGVRFLCFPSTYVFGAVSCSLCVDAQHRKDFVSFLFDFWRFWWLHFLVAGNLLGMINRFNIVVTSL